MATFQIFNTFMADGFKTFDLTDTATLYWVPLTTLPSVAAADFAALNDLDAGNGYGGSNTVQPDITSSGQTGGRYSLIIGPAAITASGGDVGPFRAFALITSTAGLIGFIDYGDDYTLPDGQTFTIQGGTVFTAAVSA